MNYRSYINTHWVKQDCLDKQHAILKELASKAASKTAKAQAKVNRMKVALATARANHENAEIAVNDAEALVEEEKENSKTDTACADAIDAAQATAKEVRDVILSLAKAEARLTARKVAEKAIATSRDQAFEIMQTTSRLADAEMGD